MTTIGRLGTAALFAGALALQGCDKGPNSYNKEENVYYSMSACKNGLGGYPEKCDRRFVDIYREDVKFRADFICAQREGSTKVRCVTEDAGMSPIAFSYDENAYSGIKENYPNITGVFKTILNQ